MSHTHSTTKRRTFKHLNAYQRGQIEAMLRLGVPKVKIAKDLEQLHGDVVVDRLRTDLNIEQVHPFGTTTDRVRCIFVLYDTGFYILDELLCRMEFRRFFAVLTMPLILDLPRLGEILFMGGISWSASARLYRALFPHTRWSVRCRDFWRFPT